MMITFQPRWVFDEIFGKGKSTEHSISKVRERLNAFDLVEPSPLLGIYGDSENREYLQYFLEDENVTGACPFHQIGSPSTPHHNKTEGEAA